MIVWQMDKEKRFKTKTGFCHILPDQIVLPRDGAIGNMASMTVGKGIAWILIIYGLLSILLIYTAIEKYKIEAYGLAILFGAGAAYLIYVVLISLNNSATPVIKRESIQKSVFKKGIKGLTRARCEVFFKDDSGKNKKRLIMLPGSLTSGDSETDIALRIMKKEDLEDYFTEILLGNQSARYNV